jgi:hypothetical protein
MQTFDELLQEKINELDAEIKEDFDILELNRSALIARELEPENDIRNKCMLLAIYRCNLKG